MSLIRLTYVSSAVHELSQAVLDSILRSASDHNKSDDITGMLLYSGGNFMQVLEGEEAVVASTYARIERDTRHRDLYLMERSPVTTREFARWSMGFRRVSSSELAAHEAYTPLSNSGLAGLRSAGQSGLALRLLRHFSESLR
jgi:hypothetical protein